MSSATSGYHVRSRTNGVAKEEVRQKEASALEQKQFIQVHNQAPDMAEVGHPLTSSLEPCKCDLPSPNRVHEILEQPIRAEWQRARA